MTIQQLRCFLAVAKTLNYTQAAELLFVSQSAVSKQIQSLEQEFQLQLFRRDRHSVILTPAGAFLAERVFGLQQQLEAAVREAQAIAARSVERFRLGVLPFLDMQRIAPELFDDFVQACPGCRLDVVSHPLEELLDVFYSEQVDAILVRSFDAVKGHELVRIPLSRGSVRIYFSRKLFPDCKDIACLQPRDFNGTTVFLQTKNRWDYHRHPNVFCKNYGFLPGEIHYIPSWDTILSQIYLGYGVTLAGPSFRITRDEDLLNIPTDGSDCGVDVVWSAGRKNPHLAAFHQIIRNMKRPSSGEGL